MDIPRETPSISEAELEILKILWSDGPCSAREIRELARTSWAHTTVLTLLGRLEDKGFVQADRRDATHRFEAAVDREGLLATRLSALANELCDGDPGPLVQALIRGRAFSAREIHRFRELIDELDQDGRKRRR